MESIAKNEVETKLLSLCSEALEPKGYRIVDLDCRIGGRSLLRIFIEREGSPEVPSPTASLEDCALVSRLLGEFLETVPEIPAGFDLEVSSPGLDRRLRLRTDFEASQGEEVQLKLVERLDGLGGLVKGQLLGVDTQKVILGLQGKEVPVPWQKIKQANRIWKTE